MRHPHRDQVWPVISLPPDTDATRLTPCEHEVVMLVADGLTNAEIAQELGIARGTVASHLQMARRRLRLTDRREVAAWVNARRDPERGFRRGTEQ
jgi:DNA-binding CsgD family transcriptional regulator